MNSNTGTAQTYEAGDQRKSKRTTPEKFESGPPNAHDLHDPKDQRSLSNRAELETRDQEREDHTRLYKMDPTAPAQAHGNKPSRGAEVDAELQQDDELRLKEKGLRSK
ncbi:hypothetical protein NM688_g5945 [Phlebia brevispora]|uniref:Uncharacterized protein n=1 Tax=Phlebia brevispora TaxID=194682 RepID=A0ACC1SMN9_9APHY|nr:hypothetical protein NM688_g5945 [Phlebia brevispora]